MAPVLDGEKRGWGVPILEDCDDECDDEEEFQEEPEEAGAEGGESWQDSGMYKSTNSVLHDLHALHQHRFVTSTSSTPSPDLSCQQRQLSLPPSSPLRPTNLIAQKDLDRLEGDGITTGELQRVMERYEDTNRLLGSLVLLRRRELQGGS